MKTAEQLLKEGWTREELEDIGREARRDEKLDRATYKGMTADERDAHDNV